MLESWFASEAPVHDSTMRQVVVAGGAGLVGQRLVQSLLHLGVQVRVLSRNPGAIHLPAGASAHGWDALPETLEGADAVINLAGEGIAERRWSAARKAAILQSRVLGTRRLVDAMKECRTPPKALVNASAVGFYGACDQTPVDEHTPSGLGFLPEVCRAWEIEALAATPLGIRVALIRIGVVLAREGGALPKMATPVRWFQGCKLGTGTQGLSWIHMDDLVAMLEEAARNPAWEGPFNATAPQPISNEAFTRLMAQRLRRPLLPIPGFLTTAGTRLLLGEMADDLLLQGVYALPIRAQSLGFQFRFPGAEDALKNLLT